MTAVRRNILSAPTARDDFIRGLKLLKGQVIDPPLSIYDFFVIWHHQAMMQHTPVTQSRRNAAHVGPVFLPWHRFFLLVLEQQLQQALNDEDFGLPYWAWNVDGDLGADAQAASAIWSSDCMGGQGNPVTDGPFAFQEADPASWRVRVEPTVSLALKTVDRGLRRAFTGSGEFPTLPNSDQAKAILGRPLYDEMPWLTDSTTTFRNGLEGWGYDAPRMHNLVHMWVNGDMGPSTSPNDPVFFLNHCNVDRMWSAWQLRHQPADYVPADTESMELAGHRLSDPLWVPPELQVTPAISDMLDHSAMYSYDTLSDLEDA